MALKIAVNASDPYDLIKLLPTKAISFGYKVARTICSCGHIAAFQENQCPNCGEMVTALPFNLPSRVVKDEDGCGCHREKPYLDIFINGPKVVLVKHWEQERSIPCDFPSSIYYLDRMDDEIYEFALKNNIFDETTKTIIKLKERFPLSFSYQLDRLLGSQSKETVEKLAESDAFFKAFCACSQINEYSFGLRMGDCSSERSCLDQLSLPTEIYNTEYIKSQNILSFFANIVNNYCKEKEVWSELLRGPQEIRGVIYALIDQGFVKGNSSFCICFEGISNYEDDPLELSKWILKWAPNLIKNEINIINYVEENGVKGSLKLNNLNEKKKFLVSSGYKETEINALFDLQTSDFVDSIIQLSQIKRTKKP